MFLFYNVKSLIMIISIFFFCVSANIFLHNTLRAQIIPKPEAINNQKAPANFRP